MTFHRKAALPNTLILLLFVTLLCQEINAQQTGRMDTDRPDQTESVSITKKGHLQAEIGFNNPFIVTGKQIGRAHV